MANTRLPMTNDTVTYTFTTTGNSNPTIPSYILTDSNTAYFDYKDSTIADLKAEIKKIKKQKIEKISIENPEEFNFFLKVLLDKIKNYTEIYNDSIDDNLVFLLEELSDTICVADES